MMKNTVIWTRAATHRHQDKKFFDLNKVSVVFLPCIKIERLKKQEIRQQVNKKLEQTRDQNYSFVICSLNALKYCAYDKKISKQLNKAKTIYCFGKKTEEKLKNNYQQVQRLNNCDSAHQLAVKLATLAKKERCIWPGAKERSFDLNMFIQERKLPWQVLYNYHTKKTIFDLYGKPLSKINIAKISSTFHRSHLICFASTSAVESFVKNIPLDKEFYTYTHYYAIGETTATECKKYFDYVSTSKSATIEELSQIAQNHKNLFS